MFGGTKRPQVRFRYIFGLEARAVTKSETEAERLRAHARRALELAGAINDPEAALRLKALAAELLERADALRAEGRDLSSHNCDYDVRSDFSSSLKSLGSSVICPLGRIANARRHAASIRGRSFWQSFSFAKPCTAFPPWSTSSRMPEPMLNRMRFTYL
jgi:hypothetical protein